MRADWIWKGRNWGTMITESRPWHSLLSRFVSSVFGCNVKLRNHNVTGRIAGRISDSYDMILISLRRPSIRIHISVSCI